MCIFFGNNVHVKCTSHMVCHIFKPLIRSHLFHYYREMWLSILQHVTNRHTWVGNQKFHKCAHRRLKRKQRKKKKWLKPKSEAFKALQAIVTDKRFLKDLARVTLFCHTGQIEVFHSMLLKYCPKRQFFPYEGEY